MRSTFSEASLLLAPVVLIVVLLAGLRASAKEPSSQPLPDVAELPSQPGLPDPLITLSGQRVTSRDQWHSQRVPEVKTLFQHYMYGYFPGPPKSIDFKIEQQDPQYFGGKATKKQITIRFEPGKDVPIHLLLVTPNKQPGPAPVFVGCNFHGNHTLLDDPSIPLPTGWVPANAPGAKDNRATDEGRGKQIDVWNIEQSIDRGYAVATFYCGDIDPDQPDFTDGVHPHYFKEGQTDPGKHDWGTITAWAWGIQRAVDYLVTDQALDPSKIAVVGHSRLGKTALLAAAFDDRIALAIPSQAGCGGTAPSRGTVGESVERINTAFPHWFNDTFPKFNQQVDKLPFDQNCLVALVAPRPVLFSNAEEDTWANPAGQFEVLQAADSVYKLLGTDGLGTDEMPPPEKLVDSTLGYYIRPGKHSMTTGDWKVWLDFADKHFGRK